MRAQGEALGLEEPQAAVGQSQRAQGHRKHWQCLLRLGGEHTGLHRAVQATKGPESKTAQPEETAWPPVTDVRHALCQPRHDCKTGLQAHPRSARLIP